MRKFLASIFVLASLISTAFAQGSLTLVGVGSAGALAVLPSISFVQNATATCDNTTCTYGTVSFGALCTERRIFLTLIGSSDGTISSVTIGGSAGALHVSNFGSTASRFVGIASAAVASGTTGSITIVGVDAPEGNLNIGIYRVCDLQNGALTATASVTANGGAMNPAAATGGVAVFASMCSATIAGNNFAWTGATEGSEQTSPGSNMRGAGATAANTGTSAPATATCSGGTLSNFGSVGVTWR